ncbi:MAG: 30S ribosomal protein S9 [Patescibacteria group bacterium]|nr:30S ribosomal protein S9 [Patescibacteria group bacterium]
MAEKYFQSVGRRKTSTAQVRLYPGGKGKITINDRDFEDYFKNDSARQKVLAPLVAVGKKESVDITVRVVGGGLTGQADATKLGIARALVQADEVLKATIKAEGLLTRDARKKERKKFGLRGARRATQWRKR